MRVLPSAPVEFAVIDCQVVLPVLPYFVVPPLSVPLLFAVCIKIAHDAVGDAGEGYNESPIAFAAALNAE